MMRSGLLTTAVLLLAGVARGQAPVDRVTIDAETREVRVPGEALQVDMPLEFICVVAGTADHEALLRTRVQPSQVHAALLGIGMEPGRPLRYSEAADRWLPPEGPPLRVEVEWQGLDGTTHRERVGRLVRNVETKEAMPPRHFVFVGSRMFGENGMGGYAADATGQVVSLVNFDSPVIDVAELASNANETLEWEVDPDAMPPQGTPVIMILSPVGAEPAGAAPATQPAAEAPNLIVVVKLRADGAISVNGEPAEPGEVARIVREQLGEGRAGAVRVAGSPEVPMRRVMDVLEALKAAGIEDVSAQQVEEVPEPDAGDAQGRIERLREEWEASVLPQSDAMRDAAAAHYALMQAYQDEINRLVDEADQLRREKDLLQERFDDLTTPRPRPTGVGVDSGS